MRKRTRRSTDRRCSGPRYSAEGSRRIERAHLDDAKEFLRALGEAILEIFEALRLCFAASIPGARVEAKQVKIGGVVVWIDLQGAPDWRFGARVILTPEIVVAGFGQRVRIVRLRSQSQFALAVNSVKLLLPQSVPAQT